ncbi:MAG: efflux RND transporter periplasmic adaptor subunit [Candidatus Omnitrophica bacterium]|nr:efflux RND transporter periplasmic adaptor subunit [Candidatus Omnitrophota bacterium]
MTPSRKQVLIIGLAAALLIGVGAVVARSGRRHGAHQAVVYYCPMHPTYTSNRPGSCPICNMTLVKREAQGSGLGAQGQPSLPRAQSPEPRAAKDICYMHNCPMMKPGQQCPMLVVAKAGEKVVCPICGTHVAEAATGPSVTPAMGEKKTLYWTDPMLPGYKSDKPGKSPMGMDLIPVYEENGAPGAATAAAPEGYAPILVAPQKRQFIGVTTAPVQRRTINKIIRTVGQIANDPELYQAQQEYLQALKALGQAKTGTMPEVTERAQRLVDSSRLRLRRLGLSHELIDEMASWTGPDQRLLLADPSGQVWLYAPIYEFELPFVQIGQTIVAESASVPGKTWEGIIRSIDPVLDPASRSARVRAILTDSEGALKPEMFVNASIQIAAGEVLAIPEEAVFDTGTKRVVFVDKGEGLFEPRDVTVGIKAEGSYEIKSGVAEGELVVTSGNFLIDSESRLKAALEGMSGSGGHQHGQ